MTVAELIRALRDLSPELTVGVTCEHDSTTHHPVNSVAPEDGLAVMWSSARFDWDARTGAFRDMVAAER